MAWFKVDDKLWGHPKWLALPMRARGLWVTAGSWSAMNETDGKIPAHVLPMLGGTPKDAQALVAAGLWKERAAGWLFHEWGVYQPDSASMKAKRSAESDGGAFGNHARWHVKRGINVPECSYCQGIPADDIEPPSEDEMYRVPDQGPESGANPPDPDPTRPDPIPVSHLGIGGEPEQRASTTPPPDFDIQPCGKRHDPEKNCGPCGRKRATDKATEEQRIKDEAERRRDAEKRESARLRSEREEAERDALRDPVKIAAILAAAKADHQATTARMGS